jgi:hypothetical protein
LNKLTVKIRGSTDLSQALSHFKSQLVGLGIELMERETLFAKVRDNVFDLARRGQDLASIGSQFRVERVLTSESCQVVLDVEFGT